MTENFVKGDETLCKEHDDVNFDFENHNEIQVLETLGLKYIDSAEVIGKMDIRGTLWEHFISNISDGPGRLFRKCSENGSGLFSGPNFRAENS